MQPNTEVASTMKDQLLNTVKQLQEKKIDLAVTPALFQWGYDEYPDIEFQMLIKAIEYEYGTKH
jgi:hypothetical protein